jgi:hypothetical protein
MALYIHTCSINSLLSLFKTHFVMLVIQKNNLCIYILLSNCPFIDPHFVSDLVLKIRLMAQMTFQILRQSTHATLDSLSEQFSLIVSSLPLGPFTKWLNFLFSCHWLPSTIFIHLYTGLRSTYHVTESNTECYLSPGSQMNKHKKQQET